MNNNDKNKRNDRRNPRRGHNFNNHQKNDTTQESTQNIDHKKILENEKQVKVELTQTNSYTRNLDPLNEGYRMPAMALFDTNEEEYTLGNEKNIKVYITLPSMQERSNLDEIEKLEILLKEFTSLNCYLITNEPVFTQTRLTQSRKLEKFRILSDFKNREFARNTGTYIYEISALVKSIFIVDRNDRILYVKYFEDLKEKFDFNIINDFLQNAIE